MSVFAPAELTTAHERLTSISQYSSDNSVRYRLTESRFVLERIRAEPLAGSGLAATIFWGRPWAQQPPKPYGFSHNGYLWLAWKIGIPAASLLVLLMALGVVLRPPPGDTLTTRAVRRGAQGAIAGLLLATMTFPSFSALSITPAYGLLLALAVCPEATRAARRSGRPVPAFHPRVAPRAQYPEHSHLAPAQPAPCPQSLLDLFYVGPSAVVVPVPGVPRPDAAPQRIARRRAPRSPPPWSRRHRATGRRRRSHRRGTSAGRRVEVDVQRGGGAGGGIAAPCGSAVRIVILDLHDPERFATVAYRVLAPIRLLSGDSAQQV